MYEIVSQILVQVQQIGAHPMSSLTIIGNLVLIESLLSVDNAAVLATMVMDLPERQRYKALTYGIVGAYVFRGLALVFAAFLINIWWLKPLGGLYLLWLVYAFLKRKKKDREKEKQTIRKENQWLYRYTLGLLGPFWATVCTLELVDIAFSMDNVFAAVAFTPNITLIAIGVFIGILAMRFIAGTFINLMKRYPFLETAAFVVIAILGLKLTLSVYEHYDKDSVLGRFLGSHTADIWVSGLSVAVFLAPLISSILFKYPRQHKGATAPLKKKI